MRFVLPLALLYLLSFMPPVAAKSDSDEPLESMLVATKESPPFAFRNAEGEWSGISIELWERLADVLDLPAPTYREMPLADMFDGLDRGAISAAVAAISVTPERVRRVDFTHPYHNTGLGVAVSASRRGGWLKSAVGQLMTWTAFTVLGATVLWLVAVGAVFWLLERRRNPLFRDAGARKGLSLGFW